MGMQYIAFSSCGFESFEIEAAEWGQIPLPAPSPTISDFQPCDGDAKAKSIPYGIVCDGIRRARDSDSPQTVLIDIRTCDLTLSQVMAAVRLMAAGLPGHEVFMDGDSYAVVARRQGILNANTAKGEVC